jgi:hypothetical protein
MDGAALLLYRGLAQSPRGSTAANDLMRLRTGFTLDSLLLPR